MAGRGGGKRGWVPPTGAQLFLKRTAQECGLDDRNLRSLQDITRPALYPDLGWLSNGSGTYDVGGPVLSSESDQKQKGKVASTKRTSQTVYLIRKQRELWHRQKALAYFVNNPNSQHQVDVARYSKQKKIKTAREQELQAIMGRNACSSLYVPQELIVVKKQRKKAAIAGADIVPDAAPSSATLEALAQKEHDPSAKPQEEGDELGADEIIEDEGEEDEAEDYVTNYYASDDESGDGEDGEDGEPTF
mmetsp:Transcript_46345/g.69009  ORF Transcript_46345/g.69009 Transcript_46345/m.69009 type:complete len:247 (-) Transcript_46345:117-857(-)